MAESQTKQTTALETRALHPRFGVEVTGVDLRKALSESVAAALRTLFARHSLLLFRDQRIDDEQQVAFSRVFGELEPTSFKVASRNPYVYELSNVDDQGNVLQPDAKKRVFLIVNQRWHTDSSYRAIPAKASILSGRTVSRDEGQTAFASMRVGYEDLSEERRRALEGLKGVHSYAYSLSLFDDAGVTGEELSTIPPVAHPLVRTHPDTGTKNLFVSGHIERVIGLPVEEGRALAQELIDWCARPEIVYTHTWRDHDLIMWDNRCMLHRAVDIPISQRRVMHRTTVAGEGPVV